MRKTRQRLCSGPGDVHVPESDSNCISATKVVRALDSGFTPSPGMQLSALTTDLGIHALRSG